jgi:hypothetical protein
VPRVPMRGPAPAPPVAGQSRWGAFTGALTGGATYVGETAAAINARLKAGLQARRREERAFQLAEEMRLYPGRFPSRFGDVRAREKKAGHIADAADARENGDFDEEQRHLALAYPGRINQATRIDPSTQNVPLEHVFGEFADRLHGPFRETADAATGRPGESLAPGAPDGDGDGDGDDDEWVDDDGEGDGRDEESPDPRNPDDSGDSDASSEVEAVDQFARFRGPEFRRAPEAPRRFRHTEADYDASTPPQKGLIMKELNLHNTRIHTHLKAMRKWYDTLDGNFQGLGAARELVASALARYQKSTVVGKRASAAKKAAVRHEMDPASHPDHPTWTFISDQQYRDNYSGVRGMDNAQYF